ncbi:MAG: glycosyltransferase [Prevotella sp.]|nr:glycosyltransferase [Prevotella sp.]
MTRPIVSVIVAVYNVEQYIRQCLDSLKAQTYSDFEVILVDDGSTDGSGKICDEYATSDKRFKVIHQPNGGVSVARQTGIENAAGEYTIHADPDDWTAPTMLEDLIKKAKDEDADMVIFDYYAVRTKPRIIRQNIPTPITAKELQKKLLAGQLHGGCCNKFIRRSCYAGIGFYPKELCTSEDVLFCLRVLNNDIKVTYLPKALYFYRMRRGSTTHIYSMQKLNSFCILSNEIDKVLGHSYDGNCNRFKVRALVMCLMLKQFKTMKNLFPEIHQDLIAEPVFSLRKPKYAHGKELSLALRGWPRLAYAFGYVHENCARLGVVEFIRKILKHQKK